MNHISHQSTVVTRLLAKFTKSTVHLFFLYPLQVTCHSRVARVVSITMATHLPTQYKHSVSEVYWHVLTATSHSFSYSPFLLTGNLLVVVTCLKGECNWLDVQVQHFVWNFHLISSHAMLGDGQQGSVQQHTLLCTPHQIKLSGRSNNPNKNGSCNNCTVSVILKLTHQKALEYNLKYFLRKLDIYTLIFLS